MKKNLTVILALAATLPAFGSTTPDRLSPELNRAITPSLSPISYPHRAPIVDFIDDNNSKDQSSQISTETIEDSKDIKINSPEEQLDIMLKEIAALHKEHLILVQNNDNITNRMIEKVEKQCQAALYHGKSARLEKKSLAEQYKQTLSNSRSARIALSNFKSSYLQKIRELFTIYHELEPSSLEKILYIPEELRLEYSNTYGLVQARREHQEVEDQDQSATKATAEVRVTPIIKPKATSVHPTFNPDMLKLSSEELFAVMSGVSR